MNLEDLHGHPLSGATPGAIDAYEHSTRLLRCYAGDPLAAAQLALQQAPQMTMAHALVGWLNLLGTEPAGLDAARAALQAARPLAAGERETMHLKAIGELVDGRWHAASRTLEDLSILWPKDLLALQVGHQVDFFTGHSRLLRDRIARALPAWHEGMPGYHAVLGMHAFGLEETGDYAQAEARGRRAAELEPRDGWAWHAVAHVLEMQDRRRDGIGWLRQDTAAWSDDSFFAVHNWWHLALFHLGLEQIDEVLALADARIVGPGSVVVMDMLDASALLWRLQLRGIDVGTRWQALAERWAPLAEAGNYAFNDLHAMMAFVGAGRDDDAKALRAAQARAAAAADDNSGFLRDVGLAATAAIEAFGHGRYGEVVERLRPIRSHAHRFGGSHAQRDLLDLTLIEAAARDGQRRLADALLQERHARGIASPVLAAATSAPVAAAPVRLRR